MQRRRFKQTLSLEERLSQEAKRLRDEAKLLPPGAAREQLLRRARQAETGSHMSEWSAFTRCDLRNELPLLTESA